MNDELEELLEMIRSTTEKIRVVNEFESIVKDEFYKWLTEPK